MALAAQRADAATAMPNLVVNGDFSQGAAGFRTDYKQVAGGRNSMAPQGGFFIGQDPNAVHDHWVSLNGTPMMMVNGATTPGATVWEEDGFKSLTASSFTVSGQAVDLCCNLPGYVYSPADIAFQVSIDGGRSFTTVAELQTQKGDAGQWQTISGGFDVLAGQTFDVRLTDLSTDARGNDFGITNLSLVDPPLGAPLPLISGVPEPSTWATMILGIALVGLRLGRSRSGRARRLSVSVGPVATEAGAA